MEAEVREWIDRVAIQDLIYRYSDGVTRGDWPQCEATFAPDAIWECPTLGLRYEPVRAFFETLRATTFEILVQTAMCPAVTFTDADRAMATTTIHEMNRSVTEIGSELASTGEQMNLDMHGIYYDDIARIGGEWKFTHRLFTPIYISPGAVTGDVMTPRADLLRAD
jgi:hypothetical protein